MDDPYGGLSIGRETTVDRVAEALRQAVFEGDLPPGAPLREVALADSLGVARGTVREALSVLVAEGLTDREPHKGVAVRRSSASDIEDVSAARTVLEVAGVRAWARADEAARQRVRDALADYATVARGRPEDAALNEAHLDFHKTLVALTGSERLLATEEQLAAEIRLALATVNRSKRNSREQVASHEALVELLEAGDLDAAEAALVRHIADGCESMIAALGLTRMG